MIEQLFVKDYILFDSAMIDFSKGMSVITGETGAGKSLLIDAIGYLMGGRIQGNIVRKGKDRCILQMVLSLPDGSILKELEENGFFIEDELIIQRIIQSNQKSSVRINQQTTTLSFVKKLCSQLIDVHSQMDTYSLMDPRVQMDLLDQYSNALELRNQVKDAFNAYEDANSLYHKIEGEDLNIDQLDLLTEQCNEIDSLYMTPEEYDSMEQRIEEASHAQRSIDSLYESLRLLNQENGVLDNLYSLSKNLNEDTVLQEKALWIQDIYYTLNEFKDEIEKRKEDLLQGVDQLDELQEKKFKLKKAMRKYGGSLNAMWQRKEELMNQIDAILHRED
ncbi:AAA family ATPase, partial [Faecalicoccus acidiformans]|uniref:AAA family ATPase n=1 Tax=Faecalicoccus acidiformans TaxID=915173 RepID=UPI0023560D8C